MIQEIVSILRFLLPFRGIFAILRHKSILLIEEAHRSNVFAFLMDELYACYNFIGNR